MRTRAQSVFLFYETPTIGKLAGSGSESESELAKSLIRIGWMEARKQMF